MITVSDLVVQFGGFELFSSVSFQIKPNDRIGLVGKNGAGKSTLLKILYGIEEASAGSVNRVNELTMGYLPQQMNVSNNTTVLKETETAFEQLNKLEAELKQKNNELLNRRDYESDEYLKLIEKVSTLNERIEMLDGAKRYQKIEQTLMGLGFKRSDFDRPTQEFSGGWRMRIELAKILLKKPDVFLLDEPTNHLDIESIQWLEDFLSSYNGAVVLISHDKVFLDNITKRTIEISLGKIYDYSTYYSDYLKQRAERIALQKAAYENQQKMIKDTEDFIERFRYKATKAVQVQSRIKQLDKIDRIEIEEEDKSSIHFKFPDAPRSGREVVNIEQLTKKYGDNLILSNLNLIVERGDKIAFIGRNGEGKTTLSKIIVGQTDYEGQCKLGHNVNIGYFAQNQDQLLDPQKTVFETLDDIAVGAVRTRIRDILGSFLFSGENIDKKVAVLSGGERSRLAMAKLLLEPYSLLVLDEPTNHLDIRSKEILKNALKQYNGTLILVSHDRDFLDGLINKFYEFTNKNIKEHLTTIQEFLHKKSLENLDLMNAQRQEKAASKTDNVSDNKKLYHERKQIEKEIRKIDKQIEACENKIARLEALIEKQEADMQQPDMADDELFRKYDHNKKQVDEQMELWEKLTEEKLELEDKKGAI